MKEVGLFASRGPVQGVGKQVLCNAKDNGEAVGSGAIAQGFTNRLLVYHGDFDWAICLKGGLNAYRLLYLRPRPRSMVIGWV